MSAQKRAQKNLNPTDTFDENPGIIHRFVPIYSQHELTSDDVIVDQPSDPVKDYEFDLHHPPPPKTPKPKDYTPRDVIEPSISTRLQLQPFPRGEVGAKFIAPETKAEKETKRIHRAEWFYNQVEFCDYEVLRLPSPVVMDTISQINEESPNVSKAKVIPARPSEMRSSYMIPPTKSALKRREIKSGIYINEISDESSLSDEEEEQAPKKKKKRKVYKKKSKKVARVDDNRGDVVMEYYSHSYPDFGDEEDEFIGPIMFSKSTHVSDNLILGRVDEIMSKASSATSMSDKSEFEDVSWCEIPLTSRLVQTLRESQCERPRKKYKKGALENHSFTKLKQTILDEFLNYTVCGTIHQGDICFPKISKNNQGICMPIAAYCYAHIKKPRDWTSVNIDEIVELGNCLYMGSIAEMHLHKGRMELKADEVQKIIIIANNKVKFTISDPEVKGLVRSTDKRIFNISRGLEVFFAKNTAGILRTDNINVLIWKIRRGCFLFFDACPRKHNLFEDKDGCALMTIVQCIKAIRTILLDRSNIGNSQFNICEIRIGKMMQKDERQEDEYIKERNTYLALNDRQAVVQGTFDLGDLCFLFNRNKQALAMSIIALAYSRISAPHCWHKKTLDKILIIGNQLHSLIIEAENCPQVGVENLPAVFTVGPYVIEIHIYANRFADLMYKKSSCIFSESLKLFLEANNNCIAQIGKSYLAIWQQRDMYFCFDPYTRNKEGLKCRKGAACVTMNKQVDTLIETILINFENREAIFHLHAVKLICIQRDPELSKYFPKHLTLHEVPIETFHKHRCMKSKKRAVEKPFATANFREHALKKLLAGTSPGNSVYEIQSTVGSIGTHMIPVVECPKGTKTRVPKPKVREPENEDHIVDLDSPSLSDTQIVPKRPNPYDEEIRIDDLASFGLTEEEKEIEEVPEGQEAGPGNVYTAEGMAEDIEAAVDHSHYGVMSQVASDELDPCFRADYINTDLTYCYKLLPALELPMRTINDREIIIDKALQDKEMNKKRNYAPINQETQILMGVNNAFDFVGEDDPNLVIPYMCIMAAAFDFEKPINRWDRTNVGFIIKAGRQLYDQYAESFIHIDDFRFEMKKQTILATIDIIFNTYIGDGLFDTFSGMKVLEDFIEKHVFSQQNIGFVFLTYYACTLFFKKNVFYLFDPYNNDDDGNAQPSFDKGKGCVMRFRSIDGLIQRLVQNLSKRIEENDESGMQFRMLILAKPKFDLGVDKEKSGIEPAQEEVRRTQSEEFKRPSNYIKLPDGSQLIRGTKHVGDYGTEVEYIAPYICIMAVAVGEKYTIRTWSSDVLDFILQAGDVLYRKAKYSFVQLVKLEIPKISLGNDNFKIQVRFIFDAPVSMRVIKIALKKVIEKERDWVFIVTEVYTCAICQRRGIYYLYNPFSCNELGLDDFSGFSSTTRFRQLEELCHRILFNKGKRDTPEHGTYLRFAMYVCRVNHRPKSQQRLKYPGDDFEKGEEYEKEGGEQEEEEEEERPPRVQHGYVKVTNTEVIQGTKALERPPSDQVNLLEDHFASLAAALMVIYKPLDQWSTKNVDKVLSLGKHIYNHADTLEPACQRTIRNILVGKYFFDVIIKVMEIENYKYRRTFHEALKYLMRKRKFLIVQTGEGSYVIYLDTDNRLVHLFHPYAATIKRGKNKEDEEVPNACWIKFKKMRRVNKFLKQGNNMNRFKFFTFSVINVTKAPRSIIVSSMIQEWIRAKQARGELTGKSFHERESWMDLHQNPWARLGPDVSSVKGTHTKCFSWDIEYNNDLFVLCGTMNEHSRSFKSEYRGKQTLCNLVTVIGMTGIYDLKEWNPSVIDAVLINGYKYFLKCAEPISEEDHEFVMEDLLDECEIFPFKFKVRYQPVIEGTMFMVNPKRYNLYRSLRFFFDDYYYRAGIIISQKQNVKKMVAFAKRKDNEYYMFDSMTFGKPMFAPHVSFAYMLRCTTLARLIHVLVLTLRGGDFYIYEVIADNYRTIQGDANPYVDEKPRLKP